MSFAIKGKLEAFITIHMNNGILDNKNKAVCSIVYETFNDLITAKGK